MMSEWLRRNTHYLLTATLVFALLFLGAESAHAQEEQVAEMPGGDQPTLSYGIRVGVGVTGVQGDAVARKDRGMHPLIGAFLNYPVANWLAVQPEALYRTHSVEVASTEQRPPQLWRYTTHYLEVPVLLKGYLPSPGDARLYLQAGPGVAFKLSGEANLAPSQTEDLPPAFGDSFSSTNFGTTVGGGLDYYIEGRLISIDVRYAIGLTDLVNDSDLPGLYNRSLDFTIGIGL